MGAPQYGLDNYIGAFNFKVTIDGIDVENSKFTSVSGVVSTSETMEFMQGDDRFVMKQPGRSMFEDIELKRVYQQIDSFYQWREMIERGVIERKLVTVSLLLPDMETIVRTMSIHDAYPSKWELPAMDSSSSEAAIETITLTCSHVTQG
jgi:phage tail-like protein|tara:strand:- start:77 stop:523 length:447 start_codon:yes stop_codon:yes gene_type:complete